jgi:hypothetical protein
MLARTRNSPAAPDDTHYQGFDCWAKSVFALDLICTQLGRASDGWSNVFDAQPITRQEAANLLAHYPVPRLKAMVEKVRAGEAIYNNPDLYHAWDPDEPASGALKRTVIVAQMTRLYRAFQPPPPSSFMRILIDEVDSARPSAYVLESACRELRRKFLTPPPIARVLSVIAAQTERWYDIITVIDEWNGTGLSIVEHWRNELEKAAAELKCRD